MGLKPHTTDYDGLNIEATWLTKNDSKLQYISGALETFQQISQMSDTYSAKLQWKM